MERVQGIGGIFFKTANPDALKDWYRRHLGITPGEDGSVMFQWREKSDAARLGYTVWAPFPDDTNYFDPSPAPFMINYRVASLDRMLEQLRQEGVPIDPLAEESEYGRFAWVMDPDGNRIELWEPPQGP